MAVFILGFLIAMVDYATRHKTDTVYSRSLKRWQGLNPELLLCGFMPILLFGDATRRAVTNHWVGPEFRQNFAEMFRSGPAPR